MVETLPSVFALLDSIQAVDLSGTSGYGLWTADRNAPSPSWPEALLTVADDRPRIGDWRGALRRSAVGYRTFERGWTPCGSSSPRCPPIGT